MFVRKRKTISEKYLKNRYDEEARVRSASHSKGKEEIE